MEENVVKASLKLVIHATILMNVSPLRVIAMQHAKTPYQVLPVPVTRGSLAMEEVV